MSCCKMPAKMNSIFLHFCPVNDYGTYVLLCRDLNSNYEQILLTVSVFSVAFAIILV